MENVEDNLLKRLQEGGLILFVAIAVFLFVALFSYNVNDSAWSQINENLNPHNHAGIAGAWAADIILYMLGIIGYVIPSLIAFLGYKIFYDSVEHPSSSLWLLRILGTLAAIICCSALASLHIERMVNLTPNSSGGLIGDLLAIPLLNTFNYTGSTLILVAIFCTSLTIGTGFSWYQFFGGCVSVLNKIYKIIKLDLQMIFRFIKDRKQKIEINNVETKEKKVEMQTESTLEIEFDEKKKGALPSIECLSKPVEVKHNNQKALTELSIVLESKLKDFKVEGTVVAINPGPVVTNFEVELAPGTKSSIVANIAHDLARSLSVPSVRVINVIPGKSVIGVEIPNEKRTIINLKSILASEAYQSSQSPLTLALGMNAIGQPVVADLAQMPHLLLAGTTGSGKSVGINSILLSILYKADVESVRLLLIDPKMLELSVYDGIPHLLTPVITDAKEATYSLKWCIDEMERRYRLMAAVGVRNIATFNHKVAQAKETGDGILDPMQDVSQQESPKYLEKMPYIVVVIDEFADLLLITNKKIEGLITRLAQKARASGIHMILATQRPSVDVITGLIKANIPSRIAYQVASKIDSRTILDQQGAEALLGKGDMLYLQTGASNLTRIHGPFVSDEETNKVVAELKTEEPKYEIFPLEERDGSSSEALQELDEMFYKASEFARNTKKISISSMQRYLRVGYNRSARIIEQLEKQGVISGRKLDGYREYLGVNSLES